MAQDGPAIKVHQALARALADAGVQTVFGLLGDANLFMMDHYVRHHGGRFVAAAHEAGAVLMALGYASTSGTVGVATVTHGPAVLNTLTSLVEGVRGATPMVLICGDTAGIDPEHMQNIAQREFLVATGAGFEQVRAPETAVADLARAFQRAVIERRPIALNVPADFQWCDTAYVPARYTVPQNRALPAAGDAFDDAVGIIAAAKRPVVLAGRGALHGPARAAIARLARRLDAPLATTLKAKSLYRHQEDSLGVFGTLSTEIANDVILGADCVVAFGASLNRHTTANGSLLRGKRVVQIDLDASAIDRYSRVDAALIGDAALVADRLVEILDEAEIPPSMFCDAEMKARIANDVLEAPRASEQAAGTIDLRLALMRLNAALAEDHVLVLDGGRFSGEAWRVFDVADPQSFVFTVNFGSIGMGMAEAIGASFGAPGRPVTLITGDGGFMFSGVTEFNTAVRSGVDLVTIVCNDGGYGAEHVQFLNRNMDPAISLIGWADLAPVATSLGGLGVTVRTEADLAVAIDAIRHRDRPILIDLKLDPEKVPSLPH